VCVCVCVRVNIPEGAAAPNENAFEAGAAAGAVVEKPPKPPVDAPKPPAGLGAAPNPPKVDIVMVLWYYGVVTVIDIIKMDLLDGVDRPLCVCACAYGVSTIRGANASINVVMIFGAD